jgi:hypothetical protein
LFKEALGVQSAACPSVRPGLDPLEKRLSFEPELIPPMIPNEFSQSSGTGKKKSSLIRSIIVFWERN